MKTMCVLMALILMSIPAVAQVSEVRLGNHHPNGRLSGNLGIDLFDQGGIIGDSTQGVQLKDLPGYKSPLKAALFSAVIPGAGQTYTERYWQGLAFFGAEVGLWVVYAVYQSRADRQTTDFQNYADAHWSVVRYADWITQYASQLAPGVNVNTSNLVPHRDPNLTPWQQVGSDGWTAINQAEDQIMTVTGNGFTHNLPMRPAQQYYELIGKYPQFLGGWDDAGNLGPQDVINSSVSAEFLGYRDMRGNANSLYAIASTATYVLVANHVLSALEAAWSAAVKNSNLKMGATLEPVRHSDGIVEFVPTARIQIDF
jgi:hypothetical protein